MAISLVSYSTSITNFVLVSSYKYPCELTELIKVKEDFSFPKESCPPNYPHPQTSLTLLFLGLQLKTFLLACAVKGISKSFHMPVCICASDNFQASQQ